MKANIVYDVFTYLLSQPPCRSGLRLRSEPDLARLFNASRQTVRRSLDLFVEQGYLTRKHGSGTYVRKVYPVDDALPENVLRRYYDNLMPEQIFIEDMLTPRHMPEQKKHSLRIGISADSALLNTTNQMIFGAAKERLLAIGHKPVSYSQLTYDTSVMKSVEALAQEIAETHCDGYLVECFWAKLFRQALLLAFPDGNCPPVTYFWPGSIDVENEPLIQLDTNEAVKRAVRILAAAHYRRIALIALDVFTHDMSQEEESYRREIARIGLNYSYCIGVRDMPGKELPSDLDAMWAAGSPDAIYVADDHYLSVLYAWINEKKLVLGRDLAVITLWNKACSLPGNINWSRLEFDPRLVGFMAIDNMIKAINSTEEDVGSFSHQATWISGNTH